MQDRQKSHKRVPLFNRGQKYLQWIDNTQKEKMKRKRNIEKGNCRVVSVTASNLPTIISTHKPARGSEDQVSFILYFSSLSLSLSRLSIK